jgi:hypothetical protein
MTPGLPRRTRPQVTALGRLVDLLRERAGAQLNSSASFCPRDRDERLRVHVVGQPQQQQLASQRQYARTPTDAAAEPQTLEEEAYSRLEDLEDAFCGPDPTGRPTPHDSGLGLALMVPNVVALLGVLLLLIAAELQVRVVEEPFLRRLHGATYEAYTARVGRFLPGLGRRSPSAPARSVA